jgi:hypothetical protein
MINFIGVLVFCFRGASRAKEGHAGSVPETFSLGIHLILNGVLPPAPKPRETGARKGGKRCRCAGVCLFGGQFKSSGRPASQSQ